jgi:protein-tyrosine phosphatase
MFKKILLVCVGNVCRSPMAACILRSKLPDKSFTISSAGVAALTGEPMDPMACEILRSHGYQDMEHKATQLQRVHVQDADLILVMEKNLMDVVLRLSPEARGKIFTLGKWQEDRAIPDPYKQSRVAFEHTFVLIQEATTSWLKYLK